MVFKSFLFDVERRQKHANNIPQKGVINQFRRHRIVISSSSSSSEHESPGSLLPAGPRGIDKLTYARFPAALIASYSLTVPLLTLHLNFIRIKTYDLEFSKGGHMFKFSVFGLCYCTGTGMPALYRIWTTGNACLFLQSFFPGFLLSLAYFDSRIALPATYDCTTILL
jgi:hypothetical protein